MAFNNNKIFALNGEKPPFSMDQAEFVKRTVVIRLSSSDYISTVQTSLKEDLKEMDFKENGNDITVSAYFSEDISGEDYVLAIVQKIDRAAKKVRNP